MINMDNKTDREKLLEFLSRYDIKSIEEILLCYLDKYNEDFSAERLNVLIGNLNCYLGNKIIKLDQARFVANERATYLKRYLDGSMWKDEKTAKEYLQPQIENAQAIIDACKSI